MKPFVKTKEVFKFNLTKNNKEADRRTERRISRYMLGYVVR